VVSDFARRSVSEVSRKPRYEIFGSVRQSRFDVRSGSRLCGNSDVELARRISVSISSFWRADCTGKLSRKKAIKKIILRVFGSSEFSHSLGQKRKCPGSRGTSVLPSGADIVSLPRHVRLVPKAEVDRALKSVYLPLKRFPKGHNLNLLVDRRCRMIGILQF
jgi:hypothetical protein